MKHRLCCHTIPVVVFGAIRSEVTPSHISLKLLDTSLISTTWREKIKKDFNLVRCALDF